MATRSRALRPGASPAARARSELRGGAAPVDAFRARSRESVTGPRTLVASLAEVDGWLLATVVALCAFGLVMVYSASEALGYAWFGDPSYFFKRQAVWLVAGVVLMFAAARLDYHRWLAWARPLALASVALLLLVLVPHLGAEKLGARRWFTLGPLSLQPSAVATMVAIVFFARWMVDRGPAVRTGRVARQFAVVLGGLLFMVIMERDLGSTLVLAVVGVVLYALAGARRRHLVVVVAGLLVLAWLAIKMEAYRSSRLSAFRDPFSDPLNSGFQSVQALFALGSGGFGGVGLGNSIQKYQWLPEAHTDFIFAIIGEELGLIGTLAVVGAFLALAWRGIRTSLRAPDTFGMLLAGGITAWISVQAFVNMAAVTNVVPTTGIPLPFVSYGGSSLLMTMLATGVLCNISAQGRRQGETRRAHVDRWGRDGGTPDPRSRGRAGTARR